MISRRRFVATALAGGSALAAYSPARPALAADSDLDACPVPPVQRPASWTSPRVAVVPRRSAFDPDYDWASLRRAYAKMRALPASDGRSLEGQRNVHAWFCGSCVGGTEIHDRWTFFVWHRGFLYFHERILGALAGDPSLRLPYWDWENASRRTLPDGYAHGALADAARFLTPGRSVERPLGPPGKRYAYDLDLVPGLIALPAATFLGTATTGSVLENAAHGFVHTSVGGYPGVDTSEDAPGDMAALETAARDPVFYAHHANVDRCWYSWERYAGHADPADPAFRRIAFGYVDERGRPVSLTAAQMLDTERLGYVYDTTIVPPHPIVRHVPLVASGAPGAVRPPSDRDAAAIAGARHVTVGLSELQVTGDGIIALEVATPSGSLSLGQLFVTPHTARGGMAAMTHSVNAQFSVPAGVATAISQPGSSITIAAAAPPPERTTLGGSRSAPMVGVPAPGGPMRSVRSAPPLARARFSAITIGVPQ